MSKKYESGTKKNVLIMMAEYAIRDQESLIEAMEDVPLYPLDVKTKEYIEECRACIRDFKRIRDNLLKYKHINDL